METQYVYSWVPEYGARSQVGCYFPEQTFEEIVKDMHETVNRDGGRVWLYEVLHTGQLKPIRSVVKVGNKIIQTDNR